MMRDDIRKLIGAYATGTLTEAEQKLLFDAALDDQELFDELTREHALKEILDEPGARDRLIAALGQPERKRFAWWPWAVAGSAAAVLVVVGIVLMRPAPKQEVAMVTPPPAPAVREEPVQPRPPSPPGSARQKVATPEGRGTNQPAADAVAPALEQAQTKAAPAAPAARALSVGGVRAAAVAALARFAFDYAVEPGGILRITPSADGYLRAIAMNGDAAGPVLEIEGAGPGGRVQAGSQVSVNVSGRDSIEILFSASPDFAAAQPPARRDEASGTVAGPAPLAVVISVK